MKLFRRLPRRPGPLEEITAGAERLAAGDLAHRVAVPEGGELEALARALNRLADELERREGELAAERRRLEETLERDSAASLRQAEIRQDLVANVSHELKTPLTAIRGYAETLRDGALQDPAAGPRFVGRILEQCERLEALLRDLLTLSRLERVEPGPGDLELLDLGELARGAAEVLGPRARERRVEIAVAAAGAPSVRGARSEVDNLLLNLIDNAVKYNRPGGRVRVAVRAERGEAVVEVADTGIGIPAGALERIFERFYRVDKGRAREQGGTGLGLAIVKHSARLLGGRVEVESRLGEGSTFRVRLPASP